MKLKKHFHKLKKMLIKGYARIFGTANAYSNQLYGYGYDRFTTPKRSINTNPWTKITGKKH